LFEQDSIKLKRRSSDTARLCNMLAYVMQAAVVKTELEVPDNRLCNALMLSDCYTQMKQFYFFARPGQRVTI